VLELALAPLGSLSLMLQGILAVVFSIFWILKEMELEVAVPAETRGVFALTNVERLRLVAGSEGSFPVAVAMTLVSQYTVPSVSPVADTVVVSPAPTLTVLLFTTVPLVLLDRISHIILAVLSSSLVIVKLTLFNVAVPSFVLGVAVTSGGAPDFIPYFTKMLCILCLQVSD
jgi:hypothetical protein